MLKGSVQREIRGEDGYRWVLVWDMAINVNLFFNVAFVFFQLISVSAQYSQNKKRFFYQ
jgi:hypothetical protein